MVTYTQVPTHGVLGRNSVGVCGIFQHTQRRRMRIHRMKQRCVNIPSRSVNMPLSTSILFCLRYNENEQRNVPLLAKAVAHQILVPCKAATYLPTRFLWLNVACSRGGAEVIGGFYRGVNVYGDTRVCMIDWCERACCMMIPVHLDVSLMSYTSLQADGQEVALVTSLAQP